MSQIMTSVSIALTDYVLCTDCVHTYYTHKNCTLKSVTNPSSSTINGY